MDRGRADRATIPPSLRRDSTACRSGWHVGFTCRTFCRRGTHVSSSLVLCYTWATLFPGPQLPMSVSSLTRGLAAMLLAPAVGHYIDIGNRLQAVRTSIGQSPTQFLSIIALRMY